MFNDRPYDVGYSKSNRAKCRVCGDLIAKDVLRFATVVQSSEFDGKIPEWHHADCFFQEYRPKSTGDFAHFDNIRWKDQEYIKQKIEQTGAPEAPEAQVTAATASTSSKSSGRKRSKDMTLESTNAEFKADYAGSDPTECHVCRKMMIKGEIRLSKRDLESGSDRWHHVECFAKLRSELQFFDEGTNISGVTDLSKVDQDAIKKALPKIKKEDVSPEAKKIKRELKDDEENDLKAQQEESFAVRDNLALLKKKELIEMLEDNEQKVPSGLNKILDALADAVLFGALDPCPMCHGHLEFESSTGYKCTKVFEWVSCEYITQNPKRKKFAISEDLKKKHPFLSDFDPRVKRRLIKVTKPSTLSVDKKEDVTDGLKPHRPLKYFTFVLAGFTNEKTEELAKEIVLLGGTVKYKVTSYTTAVIATQTEVEKSSSVIEDARNEKVHVVSEDFVEKAKIMTDNVYSLFEDKSIVDWGSWPMLRVLNAVRAGYVPKDTSDFVSSGKKKLIVKGAGIVDKESGLTETAHVFQRGEERYTISLAKVDAQMNKNSFYKMMILESDNKNEYWLFRKWGRIGTTIGRNKCDKMTRDECIEEFESLFREKTGNSWWDHKNCSKEPGMWYPIPDIDEDDDKRKIDSLEWNVESELKKPVQDLMRLIFSVELMKNAMLEYEIDMHKMPLGKISKTQIKEANLVLSELLTMVQNGVKDKAKFIKASNRFYTLIPHNFGVGSSNIIETEKQIQAKSEMLEALSRMEIAYNLLQSQTDNKQNPLDTHYKQLNTEIDVLDHESNEFKLIKKYVKNTHGKFHDKYELVVEEVFTAKRDGEESRFEPFKNLRRKLLWHGSGVTNYAGILSQGLRIAPSEAPSTGYMFGKGIYFADMVSKSANYCHPSPENSTGFLLLCDVALGNMYETLEAAPDLAKSPDNYHSVWGRGLTQPDPEKSLKLKTGVEVPCGTLVPVEFQKKCDLKHNEFIVYDVAQVKIEFIVKLTFLYKKNSKK